MSESSKIRETGVRPIFLENGKLFLLDQRKIPESVEYVDASDLDGMYAAIKDMIVRGAPAIGVAAALGLALEAKRNTNKKNHAEFLSVLELAKSKLQSARPTAVNLRWATDFVFEIAEKNGNHSLPELAELLVESAHALIEKDILINKAIGEHGARLLRHDECSILTHCNAGALATCGWGTALGIVRSVVERGCKLTVYVDETRPRQQGARLTVWELLRDGITPTLITDNMAGYVMSQGKVDAVIVGADRIACNGDAANKIGTYSLAVLAHAHGIPFYVAAPLSTIDPFTDSGSHIPIEERDSDEVLSIQGQQVAACGANVLNPAFDVTPARLITGIVTEKGVLYSPYEESIRKALQDE